MVIIIAITGAQAGKRILKGGALKVGKEFFGFKRNGVPVKYFLQRLNTSAEGIQQGIVQVKQDCSNPVDLPLNHYRAL